MNRFTSICAAAAFAIGATLPFCGASASEIVYRPINPAFGGDPFNGSFLLETARANQKKEEPKLPEFPDLGEMEGPVIIINTDGSTPIPDNP